MTDDFISWLVICGGVTLALCIAIADLARTVRYVHHKTARNAAGTEQDAMTDRELLEMAAKAAGVPAYWSDDGTIQRRPILVVKAGGGMGAMPYEAEWNPLKDDAAAFRLAVRLGLDIEVKLGAVLVRAAGDTFIEKFPATDETGFVAARRCIVRAAAELGKAMP